jgi:hypothetical protein
VCGAFGTHAAPTVHFRTPITRAATLASLGYAWTRSLGSCLWRSLHSKGGSPFSTVSSIARLRKAIHSSTRHAYLTRLLNLGPACNITCDAIDGRPWRSWAACGLNGRMLALPLSMHALVPIETAWSVRCQNTWEPPGRVSEVQMLTGNLSACALAHRSRVLRINVGTPKTLDARRFVSRRTRTTLPTITSAQR